MAESNAKYSSSSPDTQRDALAALENLGANPTSQIAPSSPLNLAANGSAAHPSATHFPPAGQSPAPPRPSAKPMPRPATPPAKNPATGPATDNGPSASGFVGMLAKDGSGIGSAEPDPLPGSRLAAHLAGDTSGRSPLSTTRPTPKPMPTSPTTAPRRANRLNDIQLARELSVSAAPARPAAPPASLRVPEWYHAAVPILYTVSLLLFSVGIWAAFGTLYLLGKISHVPLVQELSAGQEPDLWHYTPYVLLLCLPIALTLAAFARLLQRRIAKIAPTTDRLAKNAS